MFFRISCPPIKVRLSLTQIENEILESARGKVALGNYGIEIRFTQIKSLELPSSVSQTVFDRMKQERTKAGQRHQVPTPIRAPGVIRSDADSAASKLLADGRCLRPRRFKARGSWPWCSR